MKVLLCVGNCASGHSTGQRNKLPAVLELAFWLEKWEREDSEQYMRFSEVTRRSKNGQWWGPHFDLVASKGLRQERASEGRLDLGGHRAKS